MAGFLGLSLTNVVQFQAGISVTEQHLINARGVGKPVASDSLQSGQAAVIVTSHFEGWRVSCVVVG